MALPPCPSVLPEKLLLKAAMLGIGKLAGSRRGSGSDQIYFEVDSFRGSSAARAHQEQGGQVAEHTLRTSMSKQRRAKNRSKRLVMKALDLEHAFAVCWQDHRNFVDGRMATASLRRNGKSGKRCARAFVM